MIIILLGTLCADDMDECQIGLCNAANTMRCENTPGSFTCHCKDTFRGERCEVRVDSDAGPQEDQVSSTNNGSNVS